MLSQDYAEQGLDVIRSRLISRRRWKQTLAERRAALEDADSNNVSFQSERIGQAFRDAVARYQMHPLDIDVALFRPKLVVKYDLGGDRRLNAERSLLTEDNGWTSYVRNLEVVEVPGNHDSMVLEPNVRVLVSSIRRAIHSALPS